MKCIQFLYEFINFTIHTLAARQIGAPGAIGNDNVAIGRLVADESEWERKEDETFKCVFGLLQTVV